MKQKKPASNLIANNNKSRKTYNYKVGGAIAGRGTGSQSSGTRNDGYEGRTQISVYNDVAHEGYSRGKNIGGSVPHSGAVTRNQNSRLANNGTGAGLSETL